MFCLLTFLFWFWYIFVTLQTQQQISNPDVPDHPVSSGGLFFQVSMKMTLEDESVLLTLLLTLRPSDLFLLQSVLYGVLHWWRPLPTAHLCVSVQQNSSSVLVWPALGRKPDIFLSKGAFWEKM